MMCILLESGDLQPIIVPIQRYVKLHASCLDVIASTHPMHNNPPTSPPRRLRLDRIQLVLPIRPDLIDRHHLFTLMTDALPPRGG